MEECEVVRSGDEVWSSVVCEFHSTSEVGGSGGKLYSTYVCLVSRCVLVEGSFVYQVGYVLASCVAYLSCVQRSITRTTQKIHFVIFLDLFFITP